MGGGGSVSELATCKVCLNDYEVEDMIEDIEGAKYCLLDSGDICLVCGVYDHNCEEVGA
jgi:hypothetical protein